MPIHSFRCEAGHVHDALVKADVKTRECPVCGKPAGRKFLVAPKIGWLSMGTQENVSPEFIEKFDKMHRKQKEKEEKFEKEHGPGEYWNRAPGS